MIRQALYEHRYSLDAYIKWIDNRPLLPDREVAINVIKQEISLIVNLEIKLLEIT